MLSLSGSYRQAFALLGVAAGLALLALLAALLDVSVGWLVRLTRADLDAGAGRALFVS